MSGSTSQFLKSNVLPIMQISDYFTPNRILFMIISDLCAVLNNIFRHLLSHESRDSKN